MTTKEILVTCSFESTELRVGSNLEDIEDAITFLKMRKKRLEEAKEVHELE